MSNEFDGFMSSDEFVSAKELIDKQRQLIIERKLWLVKKKFELQIREEYLSRNTIQPKEKE